MPLLDQTAGFSQVNVMKGSANQAATAGACHNFSLEWLAAMYADARPANAAARMRALGKNKGGAAMVTQTVFSNEWSRQSAAAADKGVAAWRGLQFVRDIIPYAAYTEASFLAGLNGTDVAGLIYSFWFTGSVAGAGGGAHTIAFFRKMKTGRGTTGKADNQVFAFDPNFGECLIVEGGLPAWVTDMLSQYGPCNAHWMRGFRTIA
ncbi:MAG: hypothetical protein B7Z58_11895 [Acidiphilium sp. 37-64-53]|uniref:hypothetical protein n=1 Tax=Acidiphilium TaxID=522 RepID=UPI000BC5A182|nr:MULTISPECIES: hypothetical protein [Acidiphilium]OYW01355.1 MAG: hypothetical protein B7Z58_11895 [Acidiphilium sp. 37-64-53]OZB24453.1 MAG: hypothetical protein B7X49_14795 [Acidiphilium sp. 34-64-41]HQT85967.1 hypothetical protein [Acidiphilium rubrum]